MSGEFDLIRWFRSQSHPNARVLTGIGDDLAILRWRADELLLAGCDQVLDGVHFDSSLHTPRQIGRKAMNRNLSDCAAMACVPAAALVSLALPRSQSMEYAKDLYIGLREAADVFDCPIVGGDTSTWDGKLVVTVTILGRTDGIKPVERSGAQIGDDLYVTGPLGASILGRHMTFAPNIALARILAQDAYASAMVDLSDGLSRDIRHICYESRVGAEIDASAIPIHPDTRKLTDGKSPLWHALHDGEDYELLFTCRGKDPRQDDVLKEQVFKIGKIVERLGVRINTEAGNHDLQPAGWEHTIKS